MSGRKVLIFEFDQPFAVALTAAFERRGAEVTVVEDGQTGLDFLGSYRPDLIVLAIELPRMNGFAVCNRIKKNPDTREIPLVIVSSGSPQETFDQHSKLRTRAEYYAHKPVDPERLASQAWSLLGPDAEVVELPLGDAGDGLEDIVVDDESIELDAGIDAEVAGLTDSAFDKIVTPSFDPPPPDEPSVPLGGLPPVPDEFEDLTLVSSSLSLDPQLFAAVKNAQARVGASQPPPAAQASPSKGPPVLPSLRAAPVPSASAETDGLRRRVEELERELSVAQAARQRVIELTEENQRLRAHGDELARVTRELEETRNRSSSVVTQLPTRGVSTREFLELREALNRKDKDILSRDRELVELRDKLLQSDLGRADLDDRLFAREQELEALRAQGSSGAEQIATVQSELAASRERESVAQGELSALRERESVAQGELSALRERESVAQGELAASRERESAAQGELAASRERESAAQGELAASRERESAAQGELAASRERESAAQGELSALRERESVAQGELSALRERHGEIERLLEEETRRATELSEETARVRESAAKSEEELRGQHGEALVAAKREHATEMELVRRESAEAQRAHTAEVDALKAGHGAAIAALEVARTEMERAAGERGADLTTVRAEYQALEARKAEVERENIAAKSELGAMREVLKKQREREERGREMLVRARRAMEIAAGLCHEAMGEDDAGDEVNGQRSAPSEP